MKKSIIGSLIGIAIVVAADTLVRVGISLALEGEVSLFRYNIYPGIWGFLISFITLLTSFVGAAFTITYADKQKQFGVICFAIWLILIRYGQIHIVMDSELFLPITSLILSLIGVGLAWKFFFKKKQREMINEAEPVHEKKHHKTDTNPW